MLISSSSEFCFWFACLLSVSLYTSETCKGSQRLSLLMSNADIYHMAKSKNLGEIFNFDTFEPDRELLHVNINHILVCSYIIEPGSVMKFFFLLFILLFPCYGFMGKGFPPLQLHFFLFSFFPPPLFFPI